ncbi:MAG: SDR family oxidoreductase [FCB group bacterium]|nr:SDR family oxidoreductase [FCB group bacterium]
MYKTPLLEKSALKEKTILITGGGTGLGRSMAKGLLEAGANVIITSRKTEVIRKTAAELADITGGQIMAVTGDVRKYSDIEKVLAAGIDQFGAVDALINNAAGNFISPTERLTHKAFDIIVDIVLKGSYNCTLALGKYWIEHKHNGTILNIVTTYASTGSGFVVPSACAKAGVLAMTRSLAVEWAKYGIRSNAIAPGPFPTKGAWTRLFPAELAEKLDPKRRIPLNRYGHHQELVNLAAYLLSEYSAFINGEVITIDGGEWLKGAGEFNWLEMVPGEMWDQIEKSIRKRSKTKPSS